MFWLEIGSLSKSKGKHGDVVLKIDISKGFDRVQWSYLLSLITKTCFHGKWIGRVKIT